MTTPGIRWHDRGRAADEALRAHIAEVLAVDPADVTSGRHCRWCGSDRHGRPWALAADGRRPHVSLARAGRHLVTAVSTTLRVGIDIESVAAVDARWDPALVLHPAETAPSRHERAALWCRKEAILKATGDGLEVPMSSIRCADWDVEDVPAPHGLWASVAVLGPGQTAQPGSGGSSTR